VPGPPQRSTKRKGDRSARARRTAEQQLVHERWVSDAERTARAAAFTAQQALQHAEAEAYRARARAEAMHTIAADEAKRLAASSHVVPPRRTIADAVAAAEAQIDPELV
jgi:hypothetical protein